ncbi:MAG: hypothetical protein EOM74_02255 [Methanomicrobia archaeon]|nr:hypothetical protein [Methanomicrobia archaeon]
MKKSKKEILNNLRREGSVLTPDVLNNIYKTIGVEPTVISAKEKVIEKRLQAEADVFVPQDKAPVLTTESRKPRLSLGALFQRPRFVSLFATAMVAIILSVTVISLGINGFFTTDPTDTTSNTDTISIPQPIKNDQQVFSVGALTSNVLFDYVEEAPIEGAIKAMADPVISDGDIIIPQISPYLEMAEQLLSSEGQIEVVSEASEREGYDYKDTFSAYDMLGVHLDYIIYYNIDQIEENETESTYRFTGVISYGESSDEYAIEGRREIESGEAKITMLIHYDENNYVRSEYITEEDETKYRFRIYEDSALVSSSTLKLEEDENGINLNFAFDEGEDTYRYKIQYSEDNPSIIVVDYNVKLQSETPRLGQIEIEIVENAITGEPEYLITITPKGGASEERQENRGHAHGQGSEGNSGNGNK